MEITAVSSQQLMEATQHINLVKFKSISADLWEIAPVLYSDTDGIELLFKKSGSECYFKSGEEVTIKFQQSGFEYLVSGEVSDINTGYPAVVSMKYKLAQRYFNQRKHTRIDTDLKVLLKSTSKKDVESVAKNISRGGAMIVTESDIDTDSILNVQVAFKSGNLFTTEAKIMRKFKENSGKFGYGVQFIGITENNSRIINKEISLYENEYLKSLSVLRDYNKKDEMRFPAKIAIFSYEPDESYRIREELIKLGAENFEVYHNFRFVSEFFSEEKPQTVVIDADNLEQHVIETLYGINDSFGEIKILLLLPLEYISKPEVKEQVPPSVNLLFKPLIQGEFEDGIIRYLL